MNGLLEKQTWVCFHQFLCKQELNDVLGHSPGVCAWLHIAENSSFDRNASISPAKPQES